MEKDDIYRELKSLTRQRLRLIWEMAQMGVVLNDAEPSARAQGGGSRQSLCRALARRALLFP